MCANKSIAQPCIEMTKQTKRMMTALLYFIIALVVVNGMMIEVEASLVEVPVAEKLFDVFTTCSAPSLTHCEHETLGEPGLQGGLVTSKYIVRY